MPVRGGDEDLERAALIRALAEELAAIGAGEAFTVAEFCADGIVTWQVRRDWNGTPHAQHWPAVSMSSSRDDDVPYDEQLRWVTGAGFGSRLVFVYSSPDEPYAQTFGWLRFTHPDAPVFRCTAPLEAVLRDVITDDPLTQWYELVVLHRTQSGRLVFEGCQLIPPDAQRGYFQEFKIRCEASDEHGTVFAVVAAEQVRSFRLVSVESVSLEPGIYDLTAELLRPGHVGFRGLPEKLRADHRSWSELVAAVPAVFDRPQPAHLICAVEISGTAVQVLERISRIEQLIGRADGADGRLSVSLISYGSHSFDRNMPEEPTTVLTWATTSEAALSALAGLRDRGTVQVSYPHAAQLECALTEVAERLTEQQGRPVLVTVGARPAFPPRVDPHTEILPCPDRHDWRSALRRLRKYPGITFGAIHDRGSHEPIWKQLGSGAFARVDAVDVWRFAADLGLRNSVGQHVPFPFVETEGA